MFDAIIRDGRLSMPNVVARGRFQKWISENEGARVEITPVLSESGKLRRYFEGAVVPLVAFFQEGMDHTNRHDLERVREWLKLEFNGEFVDIGGTVHRYGMSTSGREVLTPFVERVQDWIVENYAPPVEALNPEKYKYWRSAVYPHGGPSTYIDYLVSLNLLKRV